MEGSHPARGLRGLLDDVFSEVRRIKRSHPTWAAAAAGKSRPATGEAGKEEKDVRLPSAAVPWPPKGGSENGGHCHPRVEAMADPDQRIVIASFRVIVNYSMPPYFCSPYRISP